MIFGDSIYFMKQGGSNAAAGGEIWRFDLDTLQTEMLYNLSGSAPSALYQNDFTLSEGVLNSQSGSLSIVDYQGVQALYYLTNSDTNGAPLGQLYRLDIVTIPEPTVCALIGGALGYLVMRRRRVRGC